MFHSLRALSKLTHLSELFYPNLYSYPRRDNLMSKITVSLVQITKSFLYFPATNFYTWMKNVKMR